VNPQKKLKTYNITFKPKDAPRYHNKTITYKANSIDEAKQKFYEEYPEQESEDYLEIHSPLSNYAIERDNEKIAETPTDNNDNDNHNINSDTADTTIPHKHQMKKFNILNIFKIVNDYVKEITMLLIGLIPLLLLGVVLFGDNFFLGNVVVYNIQNILDSMAGFVGIITLLLIVYFYNRTTDK
jgi:hypothetical protein